MSASSPRFIVSAPSVLLERLLLLELLEHRPEGAREDPDLVLRLDGQVRRLEVADADLLGRAEEPGERARDPPREEEGEDERDDERRDADEDLRVLDRAERRELLLAAAQRDGGPDERVRRGAERKEVREVRLARESSASGPIVLPCRRTAVDEIGPPRTASSDGAAPVLQRRRGERRAAPAPTASPASARKTTSAFISDLKAIATSSLIWNAAAITPTICVPPSRTGAATTL